jgi:DNA polymerase-1
LEEELVHLPEDHPRAIAIRKILEYRGWTKVNSTYYQPYLELHDSNGIVHPNLLLHGTVSGRLSCVHPNLQAVPRYSKVYKVKDVFVARPGYVLVSADYSQAEIRWGTHYAREENMAANLLADKDIHSAAAEELGIPRDAAKRINFGIIYGIGREALAKQLRIPAEKAAEYLQKYHGRYPGFRRLYKRAEEVATERGYIRMFTGRVRRYDPYNPTHKASSNLIQGAVAEMMRLAILRLDKLLEGWDTHMLLQIHDQIIFEVPEDKLFEVLPIIREGMENFLPGFELYVPMKVDIKYGPSWGQMTE